jgi:hypothetical protein
VLTVCLNTTPCRPCLTADLYDRHSPDQAHVVLAEADVSFESAVWPARNAKASSVWAEVDGAFELAFWPATLLTTPKLFRIRQGRHGLGE